MGPRNRRRLRNAAVALSAVVVVAGAAVVLLGRSPGTSGQGASDTGSTSAQKTQMIAYGMTKQQVRRLVGDPTTVQGSCWVYHSKPVSLIQLPFPGKTAADEGSAPLKVCFWDGTTQELFYWFFVPRLHKSVWARPVIVCSRSGVCTQN